MSANVSADNRDLLNRMNMTAKKVGLGDILATIDGQGSNASIIAAVLTGYVAGTQGAVSALAATDTIEAAIQKLDGNKPSYIEDTFSATFDHSVGAKTVVVRKIGKRIYLGIPAAAIADGLGTVAASGATDVPVAYRPAADTTAAVLVIDNGTTRKIGQVVVTHAGQITFSVLGAAFTNAAAAGWDACSVSLTA